VDAAEPRGPARLLAIAFVIIGICVATLAYWSPFESVTDELLLIVEGDTQFAPGYSDRAFATLKVVDAESRVREALGDPLETRPFEGREFLHYTRSPTSKSYRQRTIVLFDGAVVEIVAGFKWIDQVFRARTYTQLCAKVTLRYQCQRFPTWVRIQTI
jgi:hypothetical protein